MNLTDSKKKLLNSLCRRYHVIWVGFRHTEGVIFHNNVLLPRTISGCLAVVSYANVVENVEYETCKENKKKTKYKVDLCIFSGNQDFQQLNLEDEELFKVRNSGWLNVSVNSKPDQPPRGIFSKQRIPYPRAQREFETPTPRAEKLC